MGRIIFFALKAAPMVLYGLRHPKGKGVAVKGTENSLQDLNDFRGQK